jgi:hypothetical protein
MRNSELALILAAVVGAADLLMNIGEAERAANALAYVIAHPASSTATHRRAEELFAQLEAEICPRVILDARARAETATLDEILLELDIDD